MYALRFAMTLSMMVLVLCGVFWSAQGSRARVPDKQSASSVLQNRLNPQNISNSDRALKSSAPLEDSQYLSAASSGLLDVTTVPHRRRRWSRARVAKWSIPALMAATYLGGYLPGAGNFAVRRPAFVASNGTIGGAVPTFPSSSHSRLWTGSPAYVKDDIAPSSRIALGNAVDVVESNLPKILSHQPDWNVFKDYSKSTDGDLLWPAPPMQTEKRRVLKAVASLPDVFNKRAKVAIGVWSVFGQPGALKSLRDLAVVNQTKIHDERALREARTVVHGFGETVVKMAASTMLLPHMFKEIFQLIKHVDQNPVTYASVPAGVKDKLLDWSQRIGNVVAKKVGVADFLGADLNKWNRLPLPTQFAGIIVGLHFAPATKNLRSLLATSPGLVFTVLKEDLGKPGKALADVGGAGKRFLQRFRSQQKKLLEEYGGVDLLALEM